MTKSIIESVDGADYFILNGIRRPKSYEAIGVNLLEEKKGVKLIPVQRDNTTPIQDTILFDEYLINGEVPESQEDCISLLNTIVFKKGGGNGGGVVQQNLIIPFGKVLVCKTSAEGNQEIKEPGDYCFGVVGNTVINGNWTGGDESLAESYES
jgi:hypothetical protein